jgi:hypothetical protein
MPEVGARPRGRPTFRSWAPIKRGHVLPSRIHGVPSQGWPTCLVYARQETLVCETGRSDRTLHWVLKSTPKRFPSFGYTGFGGRCWPDGKLTRRTSSFTHSAKFMSRFLRVRAWIGCGDLIQQANRTKSALQNLPLIGCYPSRHGERIGDRRAVGDHRTAAAAGAAQAEGRQAPRARLVRVTSSLPGLGEGDTWGRRHALGDRLWLRR